MASIARRSLWLSLLSTNLLTERWSRNETLVRGLTGLGIMEELGYGLNRVTQQFAAEGLPPEFSETDATFVVTLRGHGSRMLEEAAPVRTTPATSPTRMPRAARQAWVLDHLRTVGPLTARAFATARGISEDTALRDLRDLVDQGLVAARGETNLRHYVLRLDDGGT